MPSTPEPAEGRPVPMRIAAPRPLDPAAVWDVDGTLTRADTMLPFLRRVAGPVAVTAALVPAIGLHLTGAERRVEAKAVLLRRVLGGRAASDVDPRTAPHPPTRQTRRHPPRIQECCLTSTDGILGTHSHRGERLKPAALLRYLFGKRSTSRPGPAA